MTVSELSLIIKKTIESEPLLKNVCVKGEISNLKIYNKRYYFSLKDENAIIKCVSFGIYYDFEMKEGMQILVFGDVKLYEKRGVYQLVVNECRPLGIGILHLEFQKMKEKLSKEGIFDEKYKKKIPKFPNRIGIITSKEGAVIHDMLGVIFSRFPGAHVMFIPVRVQGEGAAEEISLAIKQFNRLEKKPDVIIIGRGGGSIEDLWEFNKEVLTRAIFASEIPIISAVGHEVDYTIADFVADVRAATPTKAAEMVAPDSQEILNYINDLKYRMVQSITNTMNSRWQMVDNNFDRLKSSFSYVFRSFKDKVKYMDKILDSMNPKTICERGYAIVTDDDGNLICSIKDVEKDKRLKIIVKDGKIKSIVEDVEVE